MSYCPSQYGANGYTGRAWSDLLVDSTGLYVVEAHSDHVENTSVGKDCMELTTY